MRAAVSNESSVQYLVIRIFTGKFDMFAKCDIPLGILNHSVTVLKINNK